MFTSHAFQTADASYVSGADVEEIAKVDGLDCLFIGTLPHYITGTS
jgi:hypothetical protein